jgi:hypothetical protein
MQIFVRQKVKKDKVKYKVIAVAEGNLDLFSDKIDGEDLKKIALMTKAEIVVLNPDNDKDDDEEEDD